jgi:ABC-type Fe3+/spermidine/putrescine transport system ATPase subunit
MNTAVLTADSQQQTDLKNSADAASPASPQEGKLLLSASGLTKSYGSFQALSGISFDMREGEIISVLGPSGCGKSTLLQLVAGLAQPDGGQLALDGKVIASASGMLAPEKRGVNMVFQDYALWPHMKVYDNIAYGLRHGKMNKAEIKERVSELMAMLHLDGLEHRLPPQLSGGQQQRVAIARALATRPRLMLLDEPLSNLDMRLRVEMRSEMAYLFKRLGISVFHVTHDPEEAYAMADRIMILRNGRVDQLGTPQQVYSRPASRWAASLLGAYNGLEGKTIRVGSGNEQGIAIGSASFQGLFALDADDARDHQELILMFRPEDVKLVSTEHSKNGDNCLGATVVHCAFEGGRWRALAETAEGQRFYMVLTDAVEPGSFVSVKLEPAHAFIYPMER